MAAPVLMTLGSFMFSMDGAAFEELRRTTAYAWPEQSRIALNPAMQFTGQESDAITLQGTIYPHFRGGLGQVDGMRAQAALGTPLLLVDGLGSVKGFWVITHIEETRKAMLGVAPRRQDFVVDLKYYGPNGTDTQPKSFPVITATSIATTQGTRFNRSPIVVPGPGPAPQLSPVSAPYTPDTIGGASSGLTVDLNAAGVDVTISASL